MVIKIIDRKIDLTSGKFGKVTCNDCGINIDYDKTYYQLNFRSNKKQVCLCGSCAQILKLAIN